MAKPLQGTVIVGLNLRYVLMLHLLDTGTVRTVPQLVAAVESLGFDLAGRPGKTVSDALRWDVARGRVVRCGRGRYRAGPITRQSKFWMRKRVASLRRELAATTARRWRDEAAPRAATVATSCDTGPVGEGVGPDRLDGRRTPPSAGEAQPPHPPGVTSIHGRRCGSDAH